MNQREPALLDARRAMAEAQRDPSSAASIARGVLRRAGSSGEARAVAGWALGRSLHERDEVAQARRTLEEAAITARVAGLLELEAHVRSSLAMTMLADGKTEAALRELTRAERELRGAGRARVVMQRGVVLWHLGRLTDAEADFDAALPVLHEAGDRVAECRILANRGVLLTMLGRYDEAEADLTVGTALARELDQGLMIAGGEHNLGFLHARRGDVPTALAWFDRARASYDTLGSPSRLTSALDADRCDVLLTAGLTTEARAAAERGLDATVASGNVMAASEARVRLARVLLAQRDFGEAANEAHEAATSFRRSRRYAWAAFADYIAVQADVSASEEETRPPAKLLTHARRTAAELDRRGWGVESLHVRTFVGRLALALGRVDVARAELAHVTQSALHGGAELRVQAWHATALLRVAEGQPGAARRALRSGFRVLDAHRATLVARDLRAGSGSLGTDLARLGLRLALAEGRAREVLAWAERGRAASLRTRQLRPSEDPQLGAELTRWRHLSAEAQQATLDGRPSTSTRTELTRLEQSIRDRARHARRADGDVDDELFEQAALRRALGSTVLLEFIDVEGRLYVVRVDAARSVLHELGRSNELADEVRFLTFAVRRLAGASTTDGAARLALASLAHSAGVIDAQLLARCALPPDAAVAIVPTGSLHNVLWGALPTLRGRSVTVAPSASLWLRNAPATRARPDAHGHDAVNAGGTGDAGGTGGAAVPARRSATVGLAAGPALHGARDEVLQIARLYRRARQLVDAAATTDGVLDLLETCETVHLAAHGTFRADSPLFSSVRLADGPLSLYELERRKLAAHTIVLPVCDAGAASVQLGDELLGTATALLSLGVHAVVAPATVVSDKAMVPLMVAFHTRLRDGATPSHALASACDEARDRGHRTDLAAAAALACIGTA